MKYLSATLLASALFAAPVAAQDQTLIQHFTMDEMKRALNGVDATYVPASNERSLNVTFASSLKANALIMACADEEAFRDCYATSILALFDPPEGATPEQINAAINQYNYNENFGRAYIDEEGDISVQMYIISDGSITRENYRRQIELWEYSLQDFTTYLYPEEETAAKKKGV